MHKAVFRLGVAALVAAGLGTSAGYFLRFDLPDLRELEEYRPAQMTRMLARDGSVIATFGAEKRIVLDHGEITAAFREALIASEDSGFMHHTGIDIKGDAEAARRHCRLDTEVVWRNCRLARKLGRRERALEVYRRAVGLRPGLAEVQVELQALEREVSP